MNSSLLRKIKSYNRRGRQDRREEAGNCFLCVLGVLGGETI